MSEAEYLHHLDFRLSYGECDPAGIVYYAAYYPWFERVLNEWTYLNGFPPHKMREPGGAAHVSRASQCEYLIPGRLFDPFRCGMTFDAVGKHLVPGALRRRTPRRRQDVRDGQAHLRVRRRAVPPPAGPGPGGIQEGTAWHSGLSDE